ncbi:alanine:cation symporter family protein [Aeromicrobium sp. Leaf245]|uniref:alanine:cation symporter family protein n=1 Tax=Aeromicrobium sp. Leaf245 TaxID=1736306 RepID=UPI001F3FFA36|nr:alanine:cation symporter family protein [Aeromicrobium sp. Leaf245]
MRHRAQLTERLLQMISCVVTVLGSVVTLRDVITLADSMLFLCALVNIFGLYLLLPVVRREVREYWADKKADRLVRADS